MVKGISVSSRMKHLLVVALAACVLPVASGAPVTNSAAAIAVLPFRNATRQSDLDAFAQGMPDFVPALAGKTAGIVFVERERLPTLVRELRLPHEWEGDVTAVLRLGRLLGARYTVGGSLAASKGDGLVLNAHLYEIETGRVLGSVEIPGAAAKLNDMVQAMTSDLFKFLGKPVLPPTPDQIDRSPEANLHFMRGLGFYHASMPERAAAELIKALALDPRHASARYWNIRAYLQAGDPGHARIEYERFAGDFPGDPRREEAKALLKQAGEGGK